MLECAFWSFQQPLTADLVTGMEESSKILLPGRVLAYLVVDTVGPVDLIG